jgi:hypothetical protein
VFYLISVVLILLAAGLVAIGATGGIASAYVLAAIFSAAAIVLLIRRGRDRGERFSVSDPPVSRPPHWDRPILRSHHRKPPEGLQLPSLAIDNYDDLVAAEVMPQLEVLSVDELHDVIIRERYGKGRQSIIHRAESLIDLTLGPGSADRMVGRTVNGAKALVVDEAPLAGATATIPAPDDIVVQSAPAPKKARRRPSVDKKLDSGPPKVRKVSRQKRGPDLGL